MWTLRDQTRVYPDGLVLLTLRLVLAAVLMVSGGAKLADLGGSRAAAGDLGVPPRMAPAVGTALPIVEIALAALLVVTPTGRAAAAGAAVLFAAFTAGVASNLARGRRPPCHCFGRLSSSPISGATVVRNLVLLAAAVTVAVAGGGPDPLAL